jgi:hypothetical protein
LILILTTCFALQCFNAAKYIIHNAELKSAKNSASSDNEKSNSSIGLMIGTPYEILQYIEEGTVIPAELKYLVSVTYKRVNYVSFPQLMLMSGFSPYRNKTIFFGA